MREIEREIRVRMRTIIMLSLIRDITETLSLSLPHYRAAALLHQPKKNHSPIHITGDINQAYKLYFQFSYTHNTHISKY